MKIAIYLSGSVVKGEKSKEENKEFWGESEINTFKELLTPHEVIFLNPSERKDDLSDSQSIVGRDLLQVFCADAVVVDAREKRGLGVGIEIAVANFLKKPVVSIIPAESHYHHTNFLLLGQVIEDYTNPFLATFSDKVVRDHKEAANWIKEHLILNQDFSIKNQHFTIKNLDLICDAMKHYWDTQLAKDTPMSDLMTEHPELQEKVKKLFDQLASSKKPQKTLELPENNQAKEEIVDADSYSIVSQVLQKANPTLVPDVTNALPEDQKEPKESVELSDNNADTAVKQVHSDTATTFQL